MLLIQPLHRRVSSNPAATNRPNSLLKPQSAKLTTITVAGTKRVGGVGRGTDRKQEAPCAQDTPLRAAQPGCFAI